MGSIGWIKIGLPYMDLKLQIEKNIFKYCIELVTHTLHVFTFVKLSTTLLRYNKLEKPERFHRTLGVEKNRASQDWDNTVDVF